MSGLRAPRRSHDPGNLEPEITFWGRSGLRCGICGQPVDYLTKAHLRLKHGISKAEYLRLFPVHDHAAYWP